MRSRVTPNFWPTSSRVRGCSPLRPKRSSMTLRSRCVSVLRTRLSSSFCMISLTASTGIVASSSSMKSPSCESSSSPIGVSRLTGSWLILRISRTFCGVVPISAAISSGVGSQPMSCSSWRCTRMSLLMVSTMCTGMRIVRAIADQARTIRIPVHMVETINKLIRVQRQLLQDIGCEPTPEEIAAEMGTTPQKVREILKISQEPVSLETPIGEEEDSQLGDFIEDEEATIPVDAVSEIMQKEELNLVLSTLTHRERKVIELRFGLKGEHPRTLEEVGQKFGVTRERIRQIEAKTLAKLKAYRDSQRLRDFLD